MIDITKAIQSTRDSLKHHRKMALIHLLFLVSIILSFIALQVYESMRFSSIWHEAINAAKNGLIPQSIDVNLVGADKLGVPDSIFIDLSYLEDMAQITISLPILIITVFAIFAIYGFMRHHLKMASVNEERLFFIEKVSYVLNSIENIDQKVIASWIINEKPNYDATKDVPNFYPGFEALDKSIDMIAAIKNDLKKGVRKSS
ncbi:hypothetical protein RKK48_003597 [Vibrio cholerae]|uniref:hypothetical protein n=1 Tax=Vibrio cholerae TaxID=666 RepID=UPI0028674EA8|nr:hypothetical protein [Vibrio cholerae]ELD3372320.1 hypothetical protein [Vibrio cholerae]